MPTWVKVAIDAWTFAAGVAEGSVFRPVNRAGRVAGDSPCVPPHTYTPLLEIGHSSFLVICSLATAWGQYT